MDRGAAGLTRALRALRTRASILHITAHPDDEDGGMLAYETRGQGARGVLLTLNRGEGGQNAMSPDLYDALGLVRTQELLMSDQAPSANHAKAAERTNCTRSRLTKPSTSALSDWTSCW